MTPKIFFFCSNFESNCRNAEKIQKHYDEKFPIPEKPDLKDIDIVLFNSIIKEMSPFCKECDLFVSNK